MSDYAWVITKDHLAEPGEQDDTGMAGPSDATEAQIEKARKHGHLFRLYDDDGILYYEGRITGDMNEEDVCYAPLGDFGEGWAGCTEVRYHGHREWDCG